MNKDDSKKNSNKSKLIAVCAIAGIAIIVCVLVVCNIAFTNSFCEQYSISEDQQEGNICVNCSTNSLAEEDIELGDSLTIKFSNSYIATDVPFCTGQYANSGQPVFVQNGQTFTFRKAYYTGLWDDAHFQDDDTVSIKVMEKGKYKDLQKAMNVSYSDNPLDYSSVEKFSNFRALSGGSLKEGKFFRGASPYDNSKNRVASVNSLVEGAKIDYFISMTDTNETIAQRLQSSGEQNTYYAQQLSTGNQQNIQALDLSYISIKDKKCNNAIVSSFMKMAQDSTDKVYISGLEGKDRTGFYCALIEVIAGASYEEIVRDYMKSYEDYYGYTESGTPTEYNAIKAQFIDKFLHQITKTEETYNLSDCDFAYYGEMYLRSNGVSTKDVEAIRACLS